MYVPTPLGGLIPFGGGQGREREVQAASRGGSSAHSAKPPGECVSPRLRARLPPTG